ncbi:transmembrane protein 223 [Anthonomus grandis grandis]|uniref:transmembrane protein 223 n=1 Tax=Anthonomus grandis grandis TaxID=2921223 RepID=UPI002165D003|nr:transmembrane protein 223 [Anthonomus grandis grandis]
MYNSVRIYKSIPLLCFRRYKLQIPRLFSQQSVDVNTNVIKDVILYKSNNQRFFRLVNLCGIIQFGFWSYLSITAYSTLRDIPVDRTKKNVWWRNINFGDSKWRTTLTTISFLVGWGILTLSWMYTLRSIKYLILRKGGKEATVVTYTPWGHNRMFTLPISDMSATQARATASSFIPIKIKNHWFYYMIDMRGEFRNGPLFDSTAGLKRLFKS